MGLVTPSHSLLLLIILKLYSEEKHACGSCSSSKGPQWGLVYWHHLWPTSLESASQCYTLLYAKHPSFALGDTGQGLKTTPSRWVVLGVQWLPGVLWVHRSAYERL